MQDNPFWQYSLSVYGRPGVEQPLIQLQDEYGADVNLLLCCCWLGQQGVVLSSEQLSALIKASARWRGECIIPLRGVRRFVKEQAEAGDFYQQLKQLEIDAERIQQDLMYQQLQELTSGAGSADDQACSQNLQTYTATLPGVEWHDVADTIAELIAAIAKE